MENDFPLIILISLYGLILLTLLGLWFAAYRRRNPLAYRSAVKAKSRLEQKLILEAIAAFAGIGELREIAESIGKHASEMTGYSRWRIWLQEGEMTPKQVRQRWVDFNDPPGAQFIK